MNTLEILKGARELIAKPEHWTQGTYARDAAGRVAYWADEDACQFCALGAIGKASRKNVWSLELAFVRAVLVAAIPDSVSIEERYVPTFNDSHSHAEVLALFDKAIASEEEAVAAVEADAQVPA